MIIGIDGNEANVEKRVGISEYAFELLAQFSKLSVRQWTRNLKFIIYLKEKPREDLPKEREGFEYRVVGPKKLWTQIGLPLALFNDCRLKGRQINVFFTPTHYAPRFSPVPTVISVMDLSYIHYPKLFKKTDFYQLRSWTAYSIRKATRVFTISQASKNDIINHYAVSKEKVVVTYPGIKLKTQMPKLKSTPPVGGQNSNILEKYSIDKKYILFVGTLQPRKNIVRLIEAFSKIVDKQIQLVIIGKKGWMYEDILLAPKKYNVESRVKFLEFVPGEELPIFYKNALCFVLPSLYEGFGLPVLEAMQEGCPVITSNISSLPEAGGDAALYIDPKDTNDIAEKIEEVIKNESVRNKMIQKGYDQVKKFSWEKTAQETLKILEEVAKDNER